MAAVAVRCWWFVVVAGVLVLAGCTGSGEGAGRDDGSRADGSMATTTVMERRSGEPASTSTSVASTKPVPEVGVAEAEDLLTVLAAVVPIPADARGCVAEKLAEDPELARELRARGAKGEVPGAVMDLGSVCMTELRALPALLAGLEDSATGGLSDAQRSCVSEGYLGLDQEVRDAAVAEALGAGRGTEAAGGVEAMLADCGVKVGG